MLLMVASYRIGMFFRPAAASCYGHVTIACSDNGYEGKHCVGLLCCFCLTAASASPSFNKSACRRSRNRACSLLIVKFIDVRCFAQWNCTPKAGSLEFNNDLNTRIFVGKCGSQKPGREQAIAGSSSIASGVWVDRVGMLLQLVVESQPAGLSHGRVSIARAVAGLMLGNESSQESVMCWLLKPERSRSGLLESRFGPLFALFFGAEEHLIAAFESQSS
jgi:hypothetical protein